MLTSEDLGVYVEHSERHFAAVYKAVQVCEMQGGCRSEWLAKEGLLEKRFATLTSRDAACLCALKCFALPSCLDGLVIERSWWDMKLVGFVVWKRQACQKVAFLDMNSIGLVL